MSSDPNDVREGYCGNCHDWTGAVPGLTEIRSALNYYDQQGNPISWARYVYLEMKAQRTRTKHVGDDVTDGVRVSTVWLGEDWSFGRAAQPQIFETALFFDDKDGEATTEIFARYADEETARAGHQAAVALVRAGLLPDRT